jgi:signal transduction histidine kinase
MGPGQGPFEWLESRRTATVAVVAALTFFIILIDWKVQPSLSVGYLYVLPLMLMATVAKRWHVILYAILCAALYELMAPAGAQPINPNRMLLVLFVFLMTGLLAVEVGENYRLLSRHWDEIRIADARLRALIESGPLAILTADSAGRVMMSNAAAREMLSLGGGAESRSIIDFFPSLENPLGNAAALVGRQNHMECSGVRSDGEKFLASVWFSVYQGTSGPEMAVVVWDSSDNLRDREWASQEFMLGTSRVLMRAMAHEMRNLTGAAAQIHDGLSERPDLKDDAYFKALGTLVRTMERLSPSTLRGEGAAAGVVDVEAVLDEARIILGPSLEESDVELRWDVRGPLPQARADRAALLQVILNLSKNALRAMSASERRVFTVEAGTDGGRVTARFRDTGCGVRDPAALFQPFHPQAEGTGLGLYVSRTLVAASGGDLRYEPQPEGSCFVVELPVASGVRSR